MSAFRVLLVEDEVIVRMVLTEILADLGCTITQAATGAEAAEHLRRGAFDLLFSDVRLPGGVSGVELASTARAAHPDIPIIIASGATGGLGEQLAHLSPPPTILPKPYDFAALGRLVGSMMTRG